jgi:hypothetical protein
MAGKPTVKFSEDELSKGQLRKLTALRKSLGKDIADKAFEEWLASQPEAGAEKVDKNAELITETLGELVKNGSLKIPRGGYQVRRGRGRVIVEKVE